MDLVRRAVANTGHPSQPLHLCRAEMAMAEIKRLEDNSGQGCDSVKVVCIGAGHQMGLEGYLHTCEPFGDTFQLL